MSPLSTFACFYLVCPCDAMAGFILSTISVVSGLCVFLCLCEVFYILEVHVKSVVDINAIRIEAI